MNDDYADDKAEGCPSSFPDKNDIDSDCIVLDNRYGSILASYDRDFIRLSPGRVVDVGMEPSGACYAVIKDAAGKLDKMYQHADTYYTIFMLGDNREAIGYRCLANYVQCYGMKPERVGMDRLILLKSRKSSEYLGVEVELVDVSSTHSWVNVGVGNRIAYTRSGHPIELPPDAKCFSTTKELGDHIYDEYEAWLAWKSSPPTRYTLVYMSGLPRLVPVKKVSKRPWWKIFGKVTTS